MTQHSNCCHIRKTAKSCTLCKRLCCRLQRAAGSTATSHCGVLQVRTLPDVQMLTDFSADGVPLPPGAQLNLEVEVTPRNHGIICTLIMLDFGKKG